MPQVPWMRQARAAHHRLSMPTHKGGCSDRAAERRFSVFRVVFPRFGLCALLAPSWADNRFPACSVSFATTYRLFHWPTRLALDLSTWTNVVTAEEFVTNGTVTGRR